MRKIQQRKNIKQDGSALIVVLCVLAFLMALSGALIVSTMSVINNNKKYVDVIQCKVLNKSITSAISEKVSSTAEGTFGREMSKVVKNSGGVPVDISFKLSDSQTEAIHTIRFYNMLVGVNQELFVEISTEYNKEVYAQVLRFVGIPDETGYSWAISSISNLTSGGTQE